MISSNNAMPMIPPSAAVANDHWLTRILKTLNTT